MSFRLYRFLKNQAAVDLAYPKLVHIIYFIYYYLLILKLLINEWEVTKRLGNAIKSIKEKKLSWMLVNQMLDARLSANFD